MFLRNRIKRSQAQRQGAASVEFAFCLPVLFMLTFGTIDVCTMLFLNESASLAAYEGARRGVGRGYTNADASARVIEFAIIANILFVIVLTCIEFTRMNMVRNLAQDAAYFAARQVIVPGATKAEAIAQAENIMDSMLSGGYTVDVADFDFASEEISVTITVDMTQVAFFIPLFLTDHEIETSARMRAERYEGFYEQ